MAQQNCHLLPWCKNRQLQICNIGIKIIDQTETQLQLIYWQKWSNNNRTCLILLFCYFSAG